MIYRKNSTLLNIYLSLSLLILISVFFLINSVEIRWSILSGFLVVSGNFLLFSYLGSHMIKKSYFESDMEDQGKARGRKAPVGVIVLLSLVKVIFSFSFAYLCIVILQQNLFGFVGGAFAALNILSASCYLEMKARQIRSVGEV